MKPRCIDLFCCAGGSSKGYARAGFDVVGVDIEPQPNYPFPFIRADVTELDPRFLATFDFIAASPPCQRYSNAQRLMGNRHPDLVAPTRALLKAAKRPYAIENVVGAPLIDPVELCGAMFGLRVYRHRLFEYSFSVKAPKHPPMPFRFGKWEGVQSPAIFCTLSGIFPVSSRRAKQWALTGWCVMNCGKPFLPRSPDILEKRL